MNEMELRKHCGNDNPFRVPEGYFEGFNERLFVRLPQKTEAKVVRMSPRLWRAAAAIAFVFMLGGGLYWTQERKTSLAEQSQEEYYNDALDYIMVGNAEIAEYLTAAE